MFVLLLGIVTLIIWLGMALGRAFFWRIDREPVLPDPPAWPEVAVVIPARNEAPVIGETLRSLWAQAYPGFLRIVVVDDHSDDGTAEVARETARNLGKAADLQVLPAEPLPEGWTGKVWAMHQGVTRGVPEGDPARYVLFSDADISHGAGSLRELVARAEAEGRDLVSFMVRLQCASFAERLMIPAFVFFFKMLYPFRRINHPKDPLAGAAGGTMLVRREALRRIGGMEAIRFALIDDCALGAAIKRGGHNIWLGMSDTSISTRGYGTLAEVVRMIARTAYTQLEYSPLVLAGSVAGLGLTFLAPPLLVALGEGWGRLAAGAAWGLMTLLFVPMVRFYRLSPLWAPLLPVTATLYLWATLLSAWQHHRGSGGRWKGRSQSGKAADRKDG